MFAVVLPLFGPLSAHFAPALAQSVVSYITTDALTGQGPTPHDALFFTWRGEAAVRSGCFKLHRPRDSDSWALYDLDADPGELHNVVDDPAYRERVLDYAQRLLSWRLATDDNTLARLLVTPDGVVDVG